MVILCRDFSLQREFVHDGVDKLALVGSNHATGRTMFPRRLGLAVSGAAELKAALDCGDQRSATPFWRLILSSN